MGLFLYPYRICYQLALWVNLEGRGGYLVSYRKFQQWIAACRTLMRGCRQLSALNILWSAILQEAFRYTEEAFTQLEVLWQQRCSELSRYQST